MMPRAPFLVAALAGFLAGCQPTPASETPAAPVVVETPPPEAPPEAPAETPPETPPADGDPAPHEVPVTMTGLGGLGLDAAPGEVIGRIEGATVSEHGRLGGQPSGAQLEPGVAQRVLASQRAALRKCYVASLAQSPGLSGRLLVELTVDAAGKVQSVDVVEPLHPDVDDCVVAVFQAVTFPPPPGVVTLRYPLTFASAQ